MKSSVYGRYFWRKTSKYRNIFLLTEYSAYFKAPNEEAKAKQLEDVRNIHNPNFLSKFEEKVKKNGGHFVNNQVNQIK